MKKKTLYKRITENRATLAVVALLASMVLWVFVISTEGVLTSKDFSDVPVRFPNEDTVRESSGLIITSQDITTVDLTLTGPRRVLNQISKEQLSVSVDLSTAIVGRNSRAYTINYPPGVNESEITVPWRSAYAVSFTLDRLDSKPVEVMGEFKGSAAAGYVVEDPVFEPLTVRISGPAGSLDKIARAWVEITRENLDQTVEYPLPYKLQDKGGNVVNDPLITLETPEVMVTVRVLVEKEVPLTVGLIAGGGATEENARVTIDPQTITLVGDAQVMDSINKIELDRVDLASFTSEYIKNDYKIILPDGTESLSGVTDARVKIEIIGLSTRRMTVTNFLVENVTDGYTAAVQTESLSVNVRGPEDVLAELEDSDLYAVVDLADLGATTGRFNPIVRIYVQGHPEAGVVGSHKAFIDLTKDD